MSVASDPRKDPHLCTLHPPLPCRLATPPRHSILVNVCLCVCVCASVFLYTLLSKQHITSPSLGMHKDCLSLSLQCPRVSSLPRAGPSFLLLLQRCPCSLDPFVALKEDSVEQDVMTQRMSPLVRAVGRSPGRQGPVS